MNYEQLFDQSYERVLHRTVSGKDFFEAFYERFLASSNEVREKFRRTDMQRQRRMLKQSFYSLLVFYASNAADDYLIKMVEKHSAKGVDIPNTMYDLWMECLVETVAEFDENFASETGLAWRLVLSSGITYMKHKRW